MVPHAVFRAVVKRASFSAMTSLLYLGSVKFLPIGVVNALFNTNPIMTFFVEAIYYRKVTILRYRLQCAFTTC